MTDDIKRGDRVRDTAKRPLMQALPYHGTVLQNARVRFERELCDAVGPLHIAYLQHQIAVIGEIVKLLGLDDGPADGEGRWWMVKADGEA